MPSDELAGGGLAVVAFAVVPPIVRAIRRRRADRAPTAAPDGVVAEPAPFVATGPVDATRANTGPTPATPPRVTGPTEVL